MNNFLNIQIITPKLFEEHIQHSTFLIFFVCFGVTLNNYSYLCMLNEVENDDDD